MTSANGLCSPASVGLRFLGSVVAWSLASGITVETAQSQVVRVIVWEGQSARLPGAIASLEQGMRSRLHPALSDANGEAVLRPGASGRFRVRVDYIGRQSVRSEEFDLAIGDTVEHHVRFPSAKISLPQVMIREESQCGHTLIEGTTVATLWSEARKVLLASELRVQSPVPTLRVARFERLLGSMDQLQREHADTFFAASSRPFVTRSHGDLSRTGYRAAQKDGDIYFAPDAGVLLSDEFARDHCFSLRTDRRQSELVGLSFAPHPLRTVADISGVFWLDRGSLELRSVDFRFVNVGDLPSRARAGGQVVFARSPTGSWWVSHWFVRTPRIGLIRPAGSKLADRDTLLGARIEGATVLAVLAHSSQAPTGATAVRGMVYDSTRRRPIAGVRVAVVGSSARDTTDADGTYSLQINAGRNATISFSHSRLQLLGVSTRIDVTLTEGEFTQADLVVPSAIRLQKELCGEDPGAAMERVLLLGAVTGDASGFRPVPSVAVRATWWREASRDVTGGTRISTRATSAMASGDSAGTFRLCGLPRSATLELRLEAPGFRVHSQRIVSGSSPLLERAFRLIPCGRDDSDRVCPER